MSYKTTTEEGVNTIAEALPYGNENLPEPLATLRKKLYIKAKREPRFRFYALYDRVYRKDVLAAAWHQVASNKGSSGVDGVSIADIECLPRGVEGFLADLHEELKQKRYTPQAVRRVTVTTSESAPLSSTARGNMVSASSEFRFDTVVKADLHS